MVANPLPRPRPLPLLAEPLAPPPDVLRPRGWRVLGSRDQRNPAHDPIGALYQHMVVRYCVHGVPRQQIARETGYCERHVQAVVMGQTWAAYTQAVVQALAELGIKTRRGCRWHGSGRLREINAAQHRLLADAAAALESGDAAASERVLRQIRLLAAGQEPLEP